jgi:hypothetical protein
LNAATEEHEQKQIDKERSVAVGTWIFNYTPQALEATHA